MVMFTFFVFNRKYPFWANFVQKIKIVSLRWNLIPRLIRICRIQWWCSRFMFSAGNTFLGNFGPKNQNCQFKVKLDTYTNWNMQNSMVMFTFFVFDRKYYFWANLFKKIKIVSIRWNLIPCLIRICGIQWSCSLFLLLIENTLFVQIWSKKLKLSVYAETWSLH